MAKSEMVLYRLAATVALATLPFCLRAQTSVEEVGQVRDKLARLEVQVEVMQKQFGVEQLRHTQETWRRQIEESATGVLPTVTAIFNYNEKWQTRLMFDSGVTRLLSVGDVVSPGVRIADITHSGVTIAKAIPGKSRDAGKGRANDGEFKLIVLKPTPTTGSLVQAPIQPPTLGTPLAPPMPMGR